MVSFVGRGAPDLRRQYVLADRAGIEFPGFGGVIRKILIEATYKHLGAIFAGSHSLEPELRQRIGSSQAAFSKTSRAILRNKHYPEALRIQFLPSLIFSRLFYGLGAWPSPSPKQLTHLRATYFRMIKTVLRIAPDDAISHHELLSRARVVDPRVRIALDRLGYARRVFQLGPAALQQAVHLEKALCGESWLDSLAADLQWLAFVIPGTVPTGVTTTSDFTEIIEIWQQDSLPWKSLLRRALRKHQLQEDLMYDAHRAHDRVMHILRQAGAEFNPDFDQVL